MWARCVAAGVPDEVYWRLTPADTGVLMDEIRARDKALQDAANLRAGVVAATYANVWRKKGTPPIKPADFFRERKPPTAEQFRTQMLAWAADMKAAGKRVVVSTKEVEA